MKYQKAKIIKPKIPGYGHAIWVRSGPPCREFGIRVNNGKSVDKLAYETNLIDPLNIVRPAVLIDADWVELVNEFADDVSPINYVDFIASQPNRNVKDGDNHR